MELTDQQKKLIETAVSRYGVTGLARHLGVTRYVFYDNSRRGRGLTPDKLERIKQLMQPEIQQTSSAPIESDAPAERQLIVAWLQDLSRDELTRVIAFIADIREKRKAVESEPRKR